MSHKSTIRVYSPKQAETACEVAREKGVDIRLINGYGMETSAGLPYIREMFADVNKKYPEAECVLDVGEQQDLAQASMHMGFAQAAFEGKRAIAKKIRSMGEQAGVKIIDLSDDRESALDLSNDMIARDEDVQRTIANWLETRS